MNEQLPKDEFVVTQDGLMYWVRQRNDAHRYWTSYGLYFFKFFAIRRAKKLNRARQLVNGGEIIVWEASH